MIDGIYARVAVKAYRTRAQSDIYGYSAMRYKEKLILSAVESCDGEPVQQKWRGAGGHRYQCLVRGDRITSLTIAGPRW